MRLALAALAALLALLLPQAAAAEERILDFDSRIAIQADGTLDVTETILVRVENVAINHGIYRDFPTRYKATHGRRVRVGFQLIETLLDGQSEPNSVETRMNGVRIKIGSADRSVSPGEHRYTNRYAALNIPAELLTYIEDMPDRIGEAHLIVARAGASTIAELTAAGRPAILIPLPIATDDHRPDRLRRSGRCSPAGPRPPRPV